MLKNKCKILLLSVIIFSLISTFSFATVEPRTTDESDIMPISETYDNTVEATDVEEETTSPEWINGDFYFTDDKVTINQIIDGNAFVIADEVIVNAEIGGDLFVCANKLTIEGSYIYSNLFAVANEIIINGTIYDVYAIANDFTLDADGYVYRDLRVSANTLNINGTVRRNAFLSGATYNFNSENGALIGGNLEYSSDSEITIPEGLVTGEIKHNVEIVKKENVASKVFSYIFDAIGSLIYTFVVILLALCLAPKFVNRVSCMSTKKAFVCLGIGIIAPIIIVIAIMLILFSMICANIALAATFLFIVICMSGTAFASIYFGSLLAKVCKWNDKVKFVLATLIVALIIWAISQLPYIGGLFGFLVALFGIGILFVNAIYRKEEPKQEVVQEVEKTEE